MAEGDRSTLKIVRWVGITLGGLIAASVLAGAVGWCQDVSKRLSAIENKQSYLEGDRTRLLEEFRRFQEWVESSLMRLITNSEAQGKLLARVEAQIEGLKKE